MAVLGAEIENDNFVVIHCWLVWKIGRFKGWMKPPWKLGERDGFPR